MAALALTLSPIARADWDGSFNTDSYGVGPSVINEGGSTTASAQFSVSPANESGGAGTTTRTFNANSLTFNAPGSTAGSASPAAGGGSSVQNFAAAFTYVQNGTYTISSSQNLSAHWKENSSYGLGDPSGDTSGGVGGSAVVTVLNVAPSILSANQDGINGNITVNQGSTVVLNMTATDPGEDTQSFFINGGAAGSGGNTPGSTRTSSNVNVNYYVPGTYTNSFSVTDQDGSSSGLAMRQVTVLNLPPTITSIAINSLVPIPAADLITFIASATDPGGDALTFSWDLDEDNVFGDDTNNPTNPAVAYGIGTHKIGLTVSDPYGGSDVEYFTFTVIPEPSSVVLLGLGGTVAIALFRRRRRR